MTSHTVQIDTTEGGMTTHTCLVLAFIVLRPGWLDCFETFFYKLLFWEVFVSGDFDLSLNIVKSKPL